MTANSLMLDFCFASLLILICQFLRAKVKFIQSSFIPASLLAGFFGLLFGPNVLAWLPFSESISSYAGVITILVFASVGINGFHFSANSMKSDLKRMGSYAFYKIFVLAVQMCIPIIFGILIVSKVFPEINYGFGILLAAGFYGGHGTAAAVGSTFEKLGWPAATDLAMTFATIGILTGIFGGLLFIKWATKKGHTQYVKDFSAITDDLRTGLIEPVKRQSMGLETLSSVALDPLAFHFGLILVPAGLGYLLNQWIAKTWNLDLPTFTVAFVVALVLFFVLGGQRKKGIYKYVDSRIVTRIGSAATDFLVFFGVASIKIAVIVEYAVPLLLFTICGMIIVFLGMRVLGPAMNNESWFERSIFVCGYSTGVFAIGLTLLRIVDPENKSKTLNDTAITGPLNTPIEVFAWASGPAMLLGGAHWAFVGIYLAITIVCVALPRIFGWWYTKIPLNERMPVPEDIE